MVRRVCATVIGTAAVTLGVALPAHAEGTVEPVKKLGTVNVRNATAQAAKRPYRPLTRNSAAFARFKRFETGRHPEGAPGPASRIAPPTATGSRIAVNEVQRGFEGLDIRDTVFTNGFELEPPDQGLCGGTFEDTTFLFESVNLAIALFDTQTNQLTPPIDLNTFYGLAPFVDPETGEFGPFLSDPKCYFDPDTGRWYHTVLEAGVDPETGDFDGTANTLIAASTTRDPLGPYNIFALDATLPGCVMCIGDQPLVGADANALFISTAEYDLATDPARFFGAQIYALDKRKLSTGEAVEAVHFNTHTQFTGTVQPATNPIGRYETAQQGTEYFLSAQDCEPPDCHVDEDNLENTIGIWAVTHTRTLRTAEPDLRLAHKQIRSEVYGQPHPQEQQDGFRPLGESIGAPLPEVEANDARMNQVVFAAGRLWGGVNTLVVPGRRDGIAWFQVYPSVSASKVNGVVRKQGYIAGRKDGTYLSFPSIGVTDAGRGVVAYTLMGRRFYPSAAYSRINRHRVLSPINVARLGFRPEDGFTCYPELIGEDEARCRWGDYSASFALPNGDVWSATELIGDNARSEFANWSTFVWPIQP